MAAAAPAGIRQFLDIGAGLPTTENVHKVAQRTDPTAGIVYADNDPLVLVHARALHRDSAEFARMAFTGLDLVPPGVVLVSEWRPDDDGPLPSGDELASEIERFLRDQS